MNGRLAIVIVNYRTGALVLDCLRSLAPEVSSLPGTCVRIVDNDSQDGSFETIARFIEENDHGAWAQVLAAPRNGGFSYGNNFAIKPMLEEGGYGGFLLLNPDTFVRPGALQPLIDRLDADARIGIVGSRIETLDGKPQRSMFLFPSAIGELEWGISLGPITRLLSRWTVSRLPPESAEPCNWVSGAAMLIRRDVFDAIGVFDEGFFLYFEEVDFCLRAARAGWGCWYEPASVVVHLVGRSTGVNDDAPRRRLPTYWFDSRRRFFLKNHGAAYTAAADAGFLVGRVIGRPGKMLRGKASASPERLFSDFARNSVFGRGFRL